MTNRSTDASASAPMLPLSAPPETPAGKDWAARLGAQSVGKRVGFSVYVHRSMVVETLQDVVARAEDLAGGDQIAFQVVKFRRDEAKVSLLAYPGFFLEAFPRLTCAWSVNLDTEKVTRRKYPSTSNQPILHRKELLLGEEHDRYEEFAELTREAERLGLFESPRRIGYAWQWGEELRSRGVTTRGHRLVPARSVEEPGIARHRTAMARTQLSVPMQALWRHGFLGEGQTVLDYGCGRGDDVSALVSAGCDAVGWDPYFSPEDARRPSHVVNLGFVINVIEDSRERRETLLHAWDLTNSVLAVAAMIGGRTAYERFRVVGDGVVTSRNTFQKYYTHAELGTYIARVTGREPVSVAPGIYFVFRTAQDEQSFLERRQRSARLVAKLPNIPVRDRPRAGSRKRKLDRWIAHQQLLDEFWHCCLQLARTPDDDEFPRFDELRENLGSTKRVVNHLLTTRGANALAEVQAQRREDLLVFQALSLFERRRSFGTLAPGLQTDFKTHFGSYRRSLDAAKGLLFSIADSQAIQAACVAASEAGCGHLREGASLQLATALVPELPPILRVYVGCAEKLYGDVGSYDLVKVHIESGKLTLLLYDQFDTSPIPQLIERVKVDMRRQRIEYYNYGGEFAPQPLYLKSRYLKPSCREYARQVSFDTALQEAVPFDFADFGPPQAELDDYLRTHGFAIDGFKLVSDP